MKHASTCTALFAIITAALAGCQEPTAQPTGAAAVRGMVPESRPAATAMLVDHNTAFDQSIGQMPGKTGAEHRNLLVGALRELSFSLQLANGSVQSPEFASRIAVIDAAEKTAGDQTIPRSRMEAVENQALQAAGKALGEIQARYLFDDDQLPAMVDVVTEKTDIATGVIGPMHDLDATEAFRSIQLALQRVTDDMVERFGTTTPASEETPAAPVTPATPTPAPATVPTTTPATGPAPM